MLESAGATAAHDETDEDDYEGDEDGDCGREGDGREEFGEGGEARRSRERTGKRRESAKSSRKAAVVLPPSLDVNRQDVAVKLRGRRTTNSNCSREARGSQPRVDASEIEIAKLTTYASSVRGPASVTVTVAICVLRR